MKAHTPAPWTRHGQHIYSGTTLIARDIENPADADLIIAAPEMRETLDEALTELADFVQPEYAQKWRALLARIDGDACDSSFPRDLMEPRGRHYHCRLPSGHDGKHCDTQDPMHPEWG